MTITCAGLLQGEDMDSSDEEWANAYAAMDPASQLGWRNRRGVVEGPAEELMRDLLEAADVVHTNSMSDMAESRNTANDNPVGAVDSNAGSMPRSGDGSLSPTASVEVSQQGA
jgi:hypothetical protein